MVAAKSWISDLALRLRSDSEKKTIKSPKHPPTLGILSFETAKTMSRLLSLYKSLSEAEFSSFRRSVIRSQGVRRLNSCDEPFLLRLACAEKMDDLDRSAATVSALASRCRDIRFHDFGRTYAEMKLGSFDLVRFAFPASEIDRRISKMEGMVSSTSDLYTGLEILADMEAAERRMARWKNHPAPSPLQKPNLELFEQKLTWQRRSVRRVRDVSLWSQPFDKVVALMARFICNVYVKICVVFGPYVSDIPLVFSDGSSVSVTSRKLHFSTCEWGFPPLQIPPRTSGAHERHGLKDPNCIKPSPVPRRHLFRAFRHEKNRRHKETQEEVLVHGEFRRRERVTEAEAATLGGAALATRYANVIIMAEKMVMSPETVEEEMREDLFQMLPWRMRVAVKQKMRQYSVPAADGWKEVEGILGWLAPMAHDMIRWQVERTFVAKKEFEPQPSVMLLQTLYFSDREKAEAVIVELLVGLSSVYRQERRRRWPLAFSIGW
ncbi:DUF668 domain-containing protein/DUF3475 domain-containing protein [Cinnamomum micranthum f. kanehirae]|uniref:DUF668 domain-containing protein/DUF3475 domain-containing protein n=1 Tax=Cinnamomum micranthum f. kanehirae TaxID=337451 RepID=A0A443PXA2_9MAGN|nr:DUF668 domain-containing protein/DUF3475 domain-containing protein [Cinnamomum micranthum f. kanehirae]